MSEPWMSVEDVAGYTQMSRKWVYRHAAQLGGSKLGSALRFRRSEVDEFIESRSLRPRRRRRGGDAGLRAV